MGFAQTIALARSLLTEGRSADAYRMIEALLPPDAPTSADEAPLLLLHAQLSLLHLGDRARARETLERLRRFPSFNTLPASVRLEAELWEAWLEASDTQPDRAIHRFQHIRSRTETTPLRPELQAWLTLGLARGYATLDEYALLADLLAEEMPVVRYHRFLRRWYEALAFPVWLYQGNLERARQAADYLEHFGRSYADTLALIEGLLSRARVDQLEGSAPMQWLPLVEEAFQHLPLLSALPPTVRAQAHRLRLEGLLQQGSYETFRKHLATWKSEGTTPAERIQQMLLESEELLRMNRPEEARQLLLDRRPSPPGHFRLSIEHALQVCRTCMALGNLEEAHRWALKACGRSREIGSPYHVHRARLYEALTHAGEAVIQDLLTKVTRDRRLLSLLPLAEERARVRAHLAIVRGEDPAEHLEQALAIASLMEDPWLMIQNECALARILREHMPSRARLLLDKARDRARKHGLPLADIEALYATLPEDITPTAFHQVTIGHTLFRSALSRRLVAETWLQALEELLPEHWMAIFVYEKPDTWHQLRIRGPQPSVFEIPSPPFPRIQQLGHAYWVAIPSHTIGRTYLLGVQAPEDTAVWKAVWKRIEPWLPVLALALDHAELHRDVHPLELSSVDGQEDFVYASLVTEHLVRLAYRQARSHSPVLIEGPPGSGKKHLARLIHRHSRRAQRPLVTLHPTLADEGSDPRQMVDAAWHEAARGTLILDHVDTLPLRLQAYLAWKLEQDLPDSPRIIATTTQPLSERVERGTFHQELFARLTVMHLQVPPLKARVEDIPALTHHFLQCLHPTGAPVVGITEEAMDALMRYPWPGNVRQLRNELERVLADLSTEPVAIVSFEDLSPAIRTPEQPARQFPERPAVTLDEQVAEFEKRCIEETLAAVEGNISAAARALGLTRQGLYKKMRRLHIQPPSSVPL